LRTIPALSNPNRNRPAEVESERPPQKKRRRPLGREALPQMRGLGKKAGSGFTQTPP